MQKRQSVLEKKDTDYSRTLKYKWIMNDAIQETTVNLKSSKKFDDFVRD